MSLIYSGNFTAEIEQDQMNSVRFVCGINPESFEYLLEPGEAFDTPQMGQAIMNRLMKAAGQKKIQV